MGNPKQKWTSEEEEALRAGVAKHGAGKWKNIQRDPEFNHLLYSRSNIDLKLDQWCGGFVPVYNNDALVLEDKWRNLNVSANGQGPRDKSRTPKVKANPDAAAAPLAITYAPLSSTLVPQDASADTVMEDSSKCALDGKTASKYNQMIYDALSSLKEPNGSDTSTLVNFIEQRHEVPQNFRRLLSSRLRRLVQQDKLEKGSDLPKLYICIKRVSRLNSAPDRNGAHQSTTECLRRCGKVVCYPVHLNLHCEMLRPREKGRKYTVVLIENSYRIKKEVLEKSKTAATPKQKHVGPRQFPNNAYLGDTAEEAAITAAYKVAEAENKSFVAAEAAKEAERVSKMEEDSDNSLQIYKDLFDKCSHGEIVLLTA
ncbi:hypothetical protein MTR67_031682 [Solanum verrucosum]|uniref:MYB transcription factor n=1 Tax=Solanum verrucosum TaxID=315347 RepID=A0AAF0ZFE0_SOLVR|nr:hypothetical protein MTR67_031682 [Solanum verrucosum]